jgi:putative membrane protein
MLIRPTVRRINLLALLGLVGGLAIVTVMLCSRGFDAIWHATATLGWDGFCAVVVWHLGLIALMGVAWWLLGRGRADAILPRFVWGRLIRDSASEALPVSQIGGYVLGARALSLSRVSSAFAAGSTVVDVTVELAAQLAYTLLGLFLLQLIEPTNAFAAPVLVGVAGMAVLVAVFFAIQTRGADLLETVGARLAGSFLGRELAGRGAVRMEISRLHARPVILLWAAGVHLASWVLSGVETWLTLRLMGIALSAGDGIVIDSLLYGMRSLAFMVPNAIGVQEGSLVLLGGLFGVGADQALALSLIKRGRDLVIGVPALLIWQMLEGRRAWQRGVT